MSVLTKYHAAVQSFPLSQARIGMFKAGRYSGLDTIIAGTGTGGIPIKLSHSANTIQPASSGNALTDKEGVVMTPHGVVVKVVGDTNLIISAAAQDYRYDLIYLEYIWDDSEPGNDPTLIVMDGDEQTQEVPEVGDPATQVPIGYLHVPAGATSWDDLTYYPYAVPLPGGVNIISNFPELDARYAKLAGTNLFTGQQTVYPSSLPLSVSGNDLILDVSSNNFIISCANTTLDLNNIIRTSSRLYSLGTIIRVKFLNPGVKSGLNYSTNGHPPGFIWRAAPNVTDEESKLPIYHGDIFEFQLLPDGSSGVWHVTKYDDLMLAKLSSLHQSVYVLQTKVNALPLPTAWENVPENSTGDPDCFSLPIFTTYLVPLADQLRYRINYGGELELTGIFKVTSSATGGLQKLFKLPTAFNPQRTVVFAITRPSGLTGTATGFDLFCYITNMGDVYLTLPATPVIGDYFVNVTASFKP